MWGVMVSVAGEVRMELPTTFQALWIWAVVRQWCYFNPFFSDLFIHFSSSECPLKCRVIWLSLHSANFLISFMMWNLKLLVHYWPLDIEWLNHQNHNTGHSRPLARISLDGSLWCGFCFLSRSRTLMCNFSRSLIIFLYIRCSTVFFPLKKYLIRGFKPMFILNAR